VRDLAMIFAQLSLIRPHFETLKANWLLPSLTFFYSLVHSSLRTMAKDRCWKRSSNSCWIVNNSATRIARFA